MHVCVSTGLPTKKRWLKKRVYDMIPFFKKLYLYVRIYIDVSRDT